MSKGWAAQCGPGACPDAPSCAVDARGNRHVSAFRQPNLLGETHKANINMHHHRAEVGTLGAAPSPRLWEGCTEEPRF